MIFYSADFVRNDKVIAAAPLSGYLSIPGMFPCVSVGLGISNGISDNIMRAAYVPYHLWHESDPKKMSIILASLNSYKHEILSGNIAGTPIIQQHGQEDDNVPVFHSRRMSQLLTETGWTTDYLELPGRGHW